MNDLEIIWFILGIMGMGIILGYAYYRWLLWMIDDPLDPHARGIWNRREQPKRPRHLQRRDAGAPWKSRWRKLPKVLGS